MSKSSFIGKITKWGNSYVLIVPSQIARVYQLGQEVKVTIEDQNVC